MDVVKEFSTLLRVKSRVEERLNDSPLTPRQLFVLLVLCRNKKAQRDKATIRQVARGVERDFPEFRRLRYRAAVTDLLCQLRHKGLVKSETPKTGRAWLYHPVKRVHGVLRFARVSSGW